MRPAGSVLFLATVTVLLSAGSASSGGAHDARRIVSHIFEQADADGSGTLSPSEYEAAGLEGYGVRFEDCDANGDGETSLGEYLELYERHHPTEPATTA